jgi:hypothetical protein
MFFDFFFKKTEKNRRKPIPSRIDSEKNVIVTLSIRWSITQREKETVGVAVGRFDETHSVSTLRPKPGLQPTPKSLCTSILGDIWFWVGVPWASSALAAPLPERLSQLTLSLSTGDDQLFPRKARISGPWTFVSLNSRPRVIKKKREGWSTLDRFPESPAPARWTVHLNRCWR